MDVLLSFLLAALILTRSLITLHGAAVASSGSWDLLVSNAGVSAMHMVVFHTNKVLIFDRTDYGASAIKLPNGRCRNDSNDLALKIDCYAHSIELDVSSLSIRPLEVLTDTWCSSASFRGDGTLVQTGGWNDGEKTIRHYTSCDNCDWIEQASGFLQLPRWYASNQILPDDRVIVVGGRRQYSYEFVPGDGQFHFLQLLKNTNDGQSENNLYPFLHLLPDGNLFVFANSESILLDYKNNKVLRTYPTLPGGARSYPASGSSVMLPLLASDGFQRVEVLICGGAGKTAYSQASNGTFAAALSSCGRMVVTEEEPRWILEEMPGPRVMGDMLNLPGGDVLIINGAARGTAGWRFGREPVLSPVLYVPGKTSRFKTLAPTTIPRLYHSTAILLPDTRILVAGSNPNVGYDFSGVMFPTELRIEAFSPPYLDSSFDGTRGEIVSLSKVTVRYNGEFDLLFMVSVLEEVEVSLYAPGFATHAYSMNQRLLKLKISSPRPVRDNDTGYYTVAVQTPPTRSIAPQGYYMVFLVNSGIPSTAKWIQLL